ncbi:MAG: permease-like cell division protein FtsX [Oscillospiraceae bacterium]|nr:permease-like cell division protein FtsX [Oscillospiraceae bacterium]
MNSGSFTYLVKQGVTNAWLNRVMTLASVGILTACLIIIGGAGLLSLNVRDLFKSIENQNELVVYVADDASDAQITALGDALKKIEHVTEVSFVSKADALEEQKKSMGDKGYLLDSLEDDNPLPASYRLKLDDIQYMQTVQNSASGLASIDSVAAPTNIAETLTGIERTMVILGAIIIGILLIASIVVISNTIKLTVFARRREINIMKYVGATNGFIKFPFVVEGLTIGFLSAILAFGVICGVYSSLAEMLAGSSVAWISSVSGSLVSFWDVWYFVLGGFFLSGMLIGAFGSSSAMRKYLKV